MGDAVPAVRLSIKTWLYLAGLVVSVTTGAGYFVARAQLHEHNSRLHLDEDGLGWGVVARFETRAEAQAARDELRKVLIERIDRAQDDVIRALATPRRYQEWRRRHRKRVPTNVLPPQPEGGT